MTTWNQQTITNLLKTNDRAVERALLVLYSRQTEGERQAQQTTYRNGQGFGAFDAEIFTKFAQWLEANPSRHLTPKMLAVCRKPGKTNIPRIARYWKQLLEVIESRQKEQTS